MRWFGLYIVYGMLFICVGLFATLASHPTVAEAASSNLVIGLAAAGMAAALLHVILLKLRRNREIRDHDTLVEGIESRGARRWQPRTHDQRGRVDGHPR